MSTADLKDKLSTEMKQNPKQFVLLGLGLVVALVVWAPRLKGALGGSDPGAVLPAVPLDSDSTAVEAATASVLDTHEMLDEFRDISNEARALSRFVMPIVAPRPPRNPFHDEAQEQALLEAQRQAQRDAAASQTTTATPSAPEPDPTERDQEAVARMKLSGVFLFGAERSALIDGELRRVGDKIGRLEIMAIDSRSVTLRANGSTYRLAMKDALEPRGTSGGSRDEKDRS